MSVAFSFVPAAASLAEAKAYLRIDSDGEDALLQGLIESATALCEAFVGQYLVARSVAETIPVRADWRRLARTPVQAITGVDALTGEGAAVPLAADAYGVQIDGNGDGWVRIAAGGGAAWAVVHYRAGIADDAGAVPAPLRQGILRLTAHLYSHRDAADEGGPPAAVAALWRPWRRMRLS